MRNENTRTGDALQFRIPHSAFRICAIIPALDEEDAIGGVVRALDRALVHEVIVVDNGSRDRTAARAAAAGARVVREGRRGYGRACLAGVRAAGEADVLVFLDGDGGDVPEEVPGLLAPLLRGEADLVLGSRILGVREPGSLQGHQLWGNRLVLRLLRLLYGVRLTDFGPFRAVRAPALRALGMAHPTYGWPIEMVVKAARSGLRIAEVPVRCRRRVGRSKVAGTLRGSLLAGYHLLATVLRYARSSR
ncbi:MAG: glycosyltransferase family 2 protein [Candidatus Methylomirabilales bacterium]